MNTSSGPAAQKIGPSHLGRDAVFFWGAAERAGQDGCGVWPTSLTRSTLPSRVRLAGVGSLLGAAVDRVPSSRFMSRAASRFSDSSGVGFKPADLLA